MLTPSSGFATADISTPFPRTRSSGFTRQDLSSPAPKVTANPWDIRRILIVITIVLLAIAAYLLIHPT
jgi:hypothetical protein